MTAYDEATSSVVLKVNDGTGGSNGGSGDTTTPDDFESNHNHPICGLTCGIGKHPTIKWKAWTDSTKLPDDNKYCYYLDTDVELDEPQEIALGLDLCLNGHTISINNETVYANAVIIVNKGISFRMTNCKTSGGILNIGYLYVEEVIIRNNKATIGGGIYNNGTIDLISGEIIQNNAEDGGGIYNAVKGDLNIKGKVVIKDNRKISNPDIDSDITYKSKTIDLSDLSTDNEIKISVVTDNLEDDPIVITLIGGKQYKITYEIFEELKKGDTIKIDNRYSLRYIKDSGQLVVVYYIEQVVNPDTDDSDDNNGGGDSDDSPSPTVTPVTLPTQPDATIKNEDAIIAAHERIPGITETVVLLLEDMDNVKNSKDYIGSVFVAGRLPSGKVRSGLVLTDGTFVEGIMDYTDTFIPGTIDDNNIFVSNDPYSDNMKLVCIVDEDGYPLAPTIPDDTQQTTQTETTLSAWQPWH